MIEAAFWRGRRVFVTGHTGFKGSWLSLWLQTMGAEVTGYSLAPPPGPNLFSDARVADGMRSIIGDIRDGAMLRDAMERSRPEIVLHLAAKALVRESYANPVETYSTNVMGLVNVLEAVRATPEVRAMINVTSDKCYENREWLWGYRETDAMGGYDPYSSSKGCAELVTAAYRQSYFNPDQYGTSHQVALATARAGNVIGGGDWAADRLVPDIMRAVSGGRTVIVRNPKSIRPWQHVLEPLGGYLLLAQRLVEAGSKFAEAWNFGPADEDARPVQWIVEQLTSKWGDDASWALDETLGPHEATYLKLDCSKARAELAWSPRWNLTKALEMIVSWYKAAEVRENLQNVTLSQIAAYQSPREE